MNAAVEKYEAVVQRNDKFEVFKKRFKAYIKTRIGVTVFSWGVGFALVLFIGIPLATINKTYELGVMVAMTSVLAICSLITVFARYVDSESFPPSAFVQIGVIYFLSLSSIGLLAVDLSFTIENRAENDIDQLKRTQTFIAVMWNIIYWGSVLFGSVLQQFFTQYWQSGHFKVWDRVKHTAKSLVIRIVAGAIAMTIMFFFVFVVLKVRDISGIKAVALIFSNVLNMLQLVVLLAYGLFNLPIFLWKYADNKQSLYMELERAETVRKDYREAVADFYMTVNQCRNMISNHRTGSNTEYMDILDKELPKKDLEGATISHSSFFTLDLVPGQDVSEDYIATVRYQFKVQYFLVKRKKSRWITLFEKVNSLIDTPVTYTKEYINKNLDNPEELPILEEMALRPKPNDKKQISTFRIFSMISLIFCLFVIATEATVIYDPTYTLMYIIVEDHPLWKYRNFSFSVLFLFSIIFVCFFTIFNSKFSDFLQLVPRHTDCLQLSSMVSWSCKIITVSCFNYMTILGETAPGMSSNLFGTSYADFYSSMINVPFLGSYFNTIMPMFILIFGFIFAIFSLFKLKSKTLSAVKNFTRKNIVEDGASADQPNKITKKNDKQVAEETEQSIVQRILKGEKAILLEIDHLRKKEERVKLLRFHNTSALDALNAQKQQDIEMAASAKVKKQKSELDSSGSLDQKVKQEPPSKGPRTIEDILAAAKQRRLEETQKPLLDYEYKEENDQAQRKVSGLKKMQFGIFKKAAFEEEDNNDSKFNGSKNKTTAQQLLKADPPKGTGKDKKKMDVDSEEEQPKAMIAKKKPQKKKRKMKSVFDDSDDEEVEEEQQEVMVKKQPVKGINTTQKKKGTGKYQKEGMVLKKKRKSLFNQWDKRYMVLDGFNLHFYDDKTKKVLRNTFDLRSGNVTAVHFHYDENAPNASKKIGVKEKDESRFDLYVKKPLPRQIMFKVDDQNVWMAEDWVTNLKEALEYYSQPDQNQD